MIELTLRNKRFPFVFELKNAEREMDFCIELGLAQTQSKDVKFKVTTKFGTSRIFHANEVIGCKYLPTNKQTNKSMEVLNG